MPGCARREIVESDDVGVYHCTSRCVRRAYLCGKDSATKRDYRHRIKWLRTRIKQVAAVFMIDVLTYAILENHFHTKVRIRPDLAGKLSDWDIARRSLMLNAMTMTDDELPPEPEDAAIQAALEKEGHVEKWRDRLSDLSWFMRLIKQPIARRANQEDGVTGHFWQGRFTSVRVLDEVGSLLCSAYIDLNEVRAGIADSPEESLNSSIHERAVVWRNEQESNDALDLNELESRQTGQPTKMEPSPIFLAPVNANSPNGTASGTMTEETPDPLRPRSSNSGFLPMTVEQYFDVVDWTGRCVKDGKPGAIPGELEPIMKRLVKNLDLFVTASQDFGKLFSRFCGGPESLIAIAKQKGLKRVRGLSIMRRLCAAT